MFIGSWHSARFKSHPVVRTILTCHSIITLSENRSLRSDLRLLLGYDRNGVCVWRNKWFLVLWRGDSDMGIVDEITGNGPEVAETAIIHTLHKK